MMVTRLVETLEPLPWGALVVSPGTKSPPRLGDLGG